MPPADNPILGSSPAIGDFTPVPYDADVSNPKTLNAELPAGVSACETSWVFPRAPGVGLFRIYSTTVGDGSYRDVYLINNHFKSGPDSCVAHRTEQANYNAALVAAIQARDPNARIVAGGDLNVYPRPDDPFAPIGTPGSSDQLGALYDPSLGLKNLWEVLLGQAPAAAYSYVYLGMAQTLDQMFVNQPLLADLGQFRIAHINSDFPAEYPGDVARGTSDHDPNVAIFANVAQAGSAIPVKFSLGGNLGLDVITAATSIQIDCDTAASMDDEQPAITQRPKGLSYSVDTDQYNFVWKTDKAWSGSCRQLRLELVDGSVRLTNVEFK